MASPEGIIGGIRLDGYVITGPDDPGKAVLTAEDIKRREVRQVVELATGNKRQGIHFQGVALPMVKVKHDITLRFDRLPAAVHDSVEELLSVPSSHELVIWKTVHFTYAGTGSRRAFVLPWPIATQTYSPPSTLPPARFAPSFRVGYEGDELTVSHKSQVDYDASDPAAGNVWVVDQGTDFKLNANLAVAARLYVRIVPILTMIQAAEITKQYQGASPFREPRSIELTEV